MLGVKRLALIAGLVLLGLAPATAAQAAAQPSDQDKQYLQAIHQVNLFEIEAGNMAQQQASDQQVKDLGAMFVTDHTQLDQTVQSTASSAGVTLPDSPTADQQAVLDQLKGLNGSEFDTQWVTAQLTAHNQAVQATETEIAQGSDSSVKQIAETALPVLQAHIDELTALAQSLGIPVPGGTSGSPSPGGTPVSPSSTESPTESPTETPTESPTAIPTETTEAPVPGVTETPAPAVT
jgi:putative membrane protein